MALFTLDFRNLLFTSSCFDRFQSRRVAMLSSSYWSHVTGNPSRKISTKFAGHGTEWNSPASEPYSASSSFSAVTEAKPSSIMYWSLASVFLRSDTLLSAVLLKPPSLKIRLSSATRRGCVLRHPLSAPKEIDERSAFLGQFARTFGAFVRASTLGAMPPGSMHSGIERPKEQRARSNARRP